MGTVFLVGFRVCVCDVIWHILDALYGSFSQSSTLSGLHLPVLLLFLCVSVRGVWCFSVCQSGVFGVSLCVRQGCLAFHCVSDRGVWCFSMCQSGVFGVYVSDRGVWCFSMCQTEVLVFLYVSVRGVWCFSMCQSGVFSVSLCVRQSCLVFLCVSDRDVWCFSVCQTGCFVDHLSLPVLPTLQSCCDFTSEKGRWNVEQGRGGGGGGVETLTLVRADGNVKLRQRVPQQLVGIIFLSTYASS